MGGEARDGEPGIVPTEIVGDGESAGSVEQVAPGDHILIVDDDGQSMLNSLKRVLRKPFPDAKLDTAEDGLEAITTVRLLVDDLRSRLLLVVSDTMMPRMTGIDLYEELRKIPGLEYLPFILLSGGMPNEAVKQRFEQIAASGDPFFRFLDKPFDPTELQRVAKELVELRAQRRAAQVNTASDLTDEPGSDDESGSGIVPGV